MHSRAQLPIHSVKFNALMNSILSVSNILVSVVTIPYVTRTISLEGYGNVTFAQNVSLWLSALCLAGIPIYGLRECARVRDDIRQLTTVVKELLTIITILTSVVLGVFSLFLLFGPWFYGYKTIMWVFLLSTLILSYGVEWYFQAVEQYRYITIRSVTFKLISLLSILFFVRHDADWVVYGVIVALVVCANNIFNLIKLLRTLDFSSTNTLNLKRHVKPLCYFAVLSVSSAIYLTFDSIVLGMLSTSNVQVALYQLAAKIKYILFTLMNAVIGALISRQSYYAKNNLERFRGLSQLGFGFTLNISIGIACYFIIFSKSLVTLISSGKYAGAATPLVIVGVGIPFSFLNYFISMCLLAPLNRDKELAVANMIGVVASVAGNLLLDGRYGAAGAAIAVSTAELTILLVNLWLTKDILFHSFYAKQTLLTILSSSAAFVCMIFVEQFVVDLSSIIQLALGFCTYSAVWLVVSLCTQEPTAKWAISVMRGLGQKIVNSVTRFKSEN